MSHFFVAVIVPNGVEPKAAVDDLMSKYDENLEVDEYEKDCYCVNEEARAHAEAEVASELGTWNDARNELHSNSTISEEDKQKAWTEKYYLPRMAKINEIEKLHPMYQKPSPTCDECNGSGKRSTTYNPNSKWDWYVVGGRWDGTITGTDQPSTDNGFNFGAHHHQLKNNMVSTEHVVEKKVIPFAVVTPDGKWHERGEMGWFGMSRNEKDADAWEAYVLDLYKQYPGFRVVGVDCHI